MPPVDIEKPETLTEELLHDIPVYWMVHATISCYMDCHIWMKDISHLRTTLGAKVWNLKVMSFIGYGYYHNTNSFDVMWSNFIQPFTLKEGDSKNSHPSDNGPNNFLEEVYIVGGASGDKGF